jgi:hypothetical protein
MRPPTTGPPINDRIVIHISERPSPSDFSQHASNGNGHQHLEGCLRIHARQLSEVVIRERDDKPGGKNAPEILNACPQDRQRVLEERLGFVLRNYHDHFLLKIAAKMFAMNAPIEPFAGFEIEGGFGTSGGRGLGVVGRITVGVRFPSKLMVRSIAAMESRRPAQPSCLSTALGS